MPEVEVTPEMVGLMCDELVRSGYLWDFHYDPNDPAFRMMVEASLKFALGIAGRPDW